MWFLVFVHVLSNDNLVMTALLNASQGISHFQMTDATQLGNSQLPPVLFQDDQPILQLTHGGRQPPEMVYLGPKGRVVAPLDRIVDVGMFIISQGEEEEILFRVDLVGIE